MLTITTWIDRAVAATLNKFFEDGMVACKVCDTRVEFTRVSHRDARYFQSVLSEHGQHAHLTIDQIALKLARR